MRVTLCILSFLVLLSFWDHSIAQGVSHEKTEANKAWDSLVKTKGGRDRLFGLKSMLTIDSDLTTLDVFPDRQWQFKGPFFGNLTTTVYLGEKGMMLFAAKSGMPEILPDDDKDIRDTVAFYRIRYLLETKADRPELIRIYRTREKKKNFDVIEAKIGKTRFDAVYEPEEMLVRQIKVLDETGKVYEIYSFDEYISVNGLMMPTKIGQKACYCDLEKESFAFSKVSYQFNVDYDPEIFTNPRRAATADAWKRKP